MASRKLNPTISRILKAPEGRLREVMRKLCEEDPEVCVRVAKHLAGTHKRKFRESDNLEQAYRYGWIKRPRTAEGISYCIRCEKEYAVAENPKTTCRYHPRMSPQPPESSTSAFLTRIQTNLRWIDITMYGMTG